MSVAVYNTVIEEINENRYTAGQASEVIGNLYVRGNLTLEEYNDLMDRALELPPNNSNDEFEIRIVSIEHNISNMQEQIELILQTLSGTGTDVSSVDQPDGSKGNPIEAYRGLKYFKEKYYKDPDDENVYLCTRDRDDQPGLGLELNYLPHELVGIYFQLAE